MQRALRFLALYSLQEQAERFFVGSPKAQDLELRFCTSRGLWLRLSWRKTSAGLHREISLSSTKLELQIPEGFRAPLFDLDAFLALAADPETGLCQRNFFRYLIEEHLSDFTAHSLALVDINHFGAMSDKHPIAFLNRLLPLLRDAIEEEAGELTLLARYGNDKLSLLVPATEPELVERLQRANQRFQSKAITALGLSASFSAGARQLAQAPLDAQWEDVERRLRAAKLHRERAEEPP